MGFYNFQVKTILKLYFQVNIVYVIESAAYGVLFTSCLCQKPERARNEQIRNKNSLTIEPNANLI